MPNPESPIFVRVGQIVGAWGLKGHVKVLPLLESAPGFSKGSRLRLDGEWVTVVEGKVHKGRPLIKLEGVDSATAAEALQWHFLEAPESEIELDEDEYRTEDLIGLQVVTIDGAPVGVVSDVLPLPAH